MVARLAVTLVHQVDKLVGVHIDNGEGTIGVRIRSDARTMLVDSSVRPGGGARRC
jgi:hypothetical protein